MTLFDGLGATSKETTGGKKTHPLAHLHRKATYPFGTDSWDDKHGRAVSLSQDHYRDTGVTYDRMIPPYKNASVVELRQGQYEPNQQYKSEMTSEYKGTTAPKQPRCPPFETQVHLGDFTRRMETQYQADSRPGQPMPAVFNGTSKWPKYPPFDPINGRSRARPDPRECAPFGLKTHNFSFEYDQGIRDPVLGVVKPRPVHVGPTSAEIVAHANSETPPLRSCGALRSRLA